MPLNTKTTEEFLSDVLVAWAANVYKKTGYFFSPNLETGDPLLALFEAYCLGGLDFVQSQVVRVNKLTRAQTSEGDDVDSFCAQFKFPRKPARKATGTVKYSVRTVQTQNILITPGAIVQTKDGKIQYKVIEDTFKESWSPTLGAYVLEAGSLNCEVTVEALVAGPGSNVQAGALQQIVSPISGISFVTNLTPMLNGADREKDGPYLERFKLFINTVNKKTTPAGILSVCLDTPGVAAAKVVENQDRFGNPMPGYGYVVVDDGSGEPPSGLITTVTQNIASTWAVCRGFTTQILVIPPVKETVTIAMNVVIDPDAPVDANVLYLVTQAVLDYVNALEIGKTLHLERLSYIAQAASPYAISIQPGSLKINNAAADFTATNQTVIRTANNLLTIGPG